MPMPYISNTIKLPKYWISEEKMQTTKPQDIYYRWYWKNIVISWTTAKQKGKTKKPETFRIKINVT